MNLWKISKAWFPCVVIGIIAEEYMEQGAERWESGWDQPQVGAAIRLGDVEVGWDVLQW